MPTIPLFANWTWKRSLPEPFDKTSGTISTTHYSTYCIVSTTCVSPVRLLYSATIFSSWVPMAHSEVLAGVKVVSMSM